MNDQSENVTALKNRFAHVYDGETVVPDNFAAHMTVLHWAMAEHTLNTLETSLDQISICFAVSKIIFFYADEIAKNPQLWDEENNTNHTLAQNNFTLAQIDMSISETVLNHEVRLLQEAVEPDQASVMKTIGLVDRYQQLVVRFKEAVDRLSESGDRKQQGLEIYSEMDKPDLQGVDAQDKLKQLHLASSKNAEKAIAQTIDVANDFIEILKVQDASQREALREQFDAFVGRIDVLEDVRDNRLMASKFNFG